MAKTDFLSFDTTASNNTDINGIGILGSNAVKNFDDAFRTLMAILRRDLDNGVVYAAKSGNYTAVANDNNAWHRYTATATVSLTAAATLGADWHYTVSAVGDSTVVTIDPNASETIGGVSTLVIRGGQTAFIICDGTNFQVDIRGAAYASQSGNYTALLGDKNTVQRFTAAATLALTAAATLGNSWEITVIADGASVTIDPNGSETINGATTIIVSNGSTAKIVCDGSNFFIVQKPNVWETLEVRTVSAQSTIDFTDARLANARAIRISGTLAASSAGNLILRTSTNGGSSYDAGASDYSYQVQFSTNTAVTTSGTSSTFMFMMNMDASADTEFEITLDDFNQAKVCSMLGRAVSVFSSALILTVFGGRRLQTTARNAFRVLASAGTLTGVIRVEILRG